MLDPNLDYATDSLYLDTIIFLIAVEPFHWEEGE